MRAFSDAPVELPTGTGAEALYVNVRGDHGKRLDLNIEHCPFGLKSYSTDGSVARHHPSSHKVGGFFVVPQSCHRCRRDRWHVPPESTRTTSSPFKLGATSIAKHSRV